MSNWNFADIWETVAQVQADRVAITQGTMTTSWSAFDRRADGLAAWLLGLGVEHQDKVALYLYNGPEYLEGLFATFKAGLVPVNTNYRYSDDELVYLWENADAVAVVFHGTFTARIEGLRSRVPTVKAWLWVDDGTGPRPDWAADYLEVVGGPEGAAPTDGGPTRAPWGRSGDDILMIYTGGTTGMPKGVMWRQDDLFAKLNSTGIRRYDLDLGLDGIRQRLLDDGPGAVVLPSCPLMHGTGAFTASECLAEGGRVVLLAGRRFDPVELLETVDRERVNSLVIVGDAFARPIMNVLDARPDDWDLSSLKGVVSSGAMWSEPVKQAFLAHRPHLLLIDSFGSSEALGMGSSVSSAGEARSTAEFTLGPKVQVLDPDGRPLAPGSDEIGVLALGGRMPLGYYKDPAKTATVFKEIGGVRYSVPGDYARVRADGSIQLLGRGSVCINTGGEKVFPEEVEETLKTHPAVADAIVVGVPDERFGERIVAAVELVDGGQTTEAELIDHVRHRLADYKAPRRVRILDSIGRSPSGKLDYRRHRDEAATWAGATV